MKKADTVLDLMARAFAIDVNILKDCCELYNSAKTIDVLDECMLAAFIGDEPELELTPEPEPEKCGFISNLLKALDKLPKQPETEESAEELELHHPVQDPEPPAAPAVPKEQSFIGRGSAEKQAIFTRLQEYTERSGSGWAARLSEASKGSLSASTIRDMLNCGKHPLAEWIMLRRALDAVEGTEAGA